MSNRLATEASPYLRQHADNPVDWYPWGDEAVDEARRTGKAILLSIGYAACHWCHVMAHESFEDHTTAELMNEMFVNVKVDREERPDVDAVYMDATQAMTGRGGWPMTVFIVPDGRPFWAGTYFPPTRRHGMPSFTEVLHAVHDAWTNKRDEVLEQADQITEAVRERSSGGFRVKSSVSIAEQHGAADPFPATVDMLLANHDDRLGGFGGAPKFPQPSMLDALLVGALEGNDDARRAAIRTLNAMAAGGIHDHVGGGFARYSVDAQWLVPHFEKMLYDQAGFVRVYTHAAQLTGDAWYRTVVERTVGYVLRDLRLPGGGLASAEDADSEGHEGLFQTWTRAELVAALNDAGLDAVSLTNEVCAFYGVTDTGNFEGRNIFVRPIDADPTVPPTVAAAVDALFAAREQRVRPLRDDKVITETNAMFIAALAEAGAAFDRPEWIAAAVGVADFLLANLRRSDARWLRAWQAQAGAQHLAVASDVAWLVDAFTRLGEASGDPRWTVEACAAADALLDLFWDHDDGGLFTVGRDAPALVANPKETFDGATPSANAVGALALARLAALTGDARYEDNARAIVSGLPVGEHPAGFSHASFAAHVLTTGATEVVIPGRGDTTVALRNAYCGAWRPLAVIAWGEPFASPLWDGRTEGNAYVCRNFVCETPVSDPADLASRL